jgi:hypothetical protein
MPINFSTIHHIHLHWFWEGFIERDSIMGIWINSYLTDIDLGHLLTNSPRRDKKSDFKNSQSPQNMSESFDQKTPLQGIGEKI